MTVLLAIAAGAIGALARAEVGVWFATRDGSTNRATTTVNLVGALVLGFLLAGSSGNTAYVVGAGFLGGFTTFSTWMVEAATSRDPGVVVLVPTAIGVVAAAVGFALG